MAAAAGVVIAALVGAWALGRALTEGSAERRPVRFTIELDSTVLRFGEPAISPDGGTIVYAAEAPDATRLYVRRVDDIASRPLAGTENADAAFFSPDGAWVAFYSTALSARSNWMAAPPAVVTEVPPPAVFAGATWGSDGTIYYAVSPSGALYHVPAAGGRPSRVTVADSTVRLVGPRSLPEGGALLVTIMENFAYFAGQIAVLDLASGRLRTIGPGSGARYADGHLVYAGLRGELFRQPFDLRRLETTATAEQLASGLSPVLTFGQFAFDASEGGALVYVVGARRYSRGAVKLALLDSSGRERRSFPARTPWTPRFAPDGQRVLHAGFPAGLDRTEVWVTDLRTGNTQRLTNDEQENNDPVWSPDGTQIAHSALAPEGKDIYVRALDGGQRGLLVHRPGDQWPTDWLRDGSALLFTEFTSKGDIDILIQPADGRPAQPYLATPAEESGARISPDGRWVAYQSDESGRDEVYVGPYPGPGPKTLVSAAGGVNPVWRPDGRALYYWKVDQLMVASVKPGGAGAPLVVPTPPTLVFRAPYVEAVLAMYDVSPDGTQFVVVIGETRTSRLVVALDALGGGATGRR